MLFLERQQRLQQQPRIDVAVATSLVVGILSSACEATRKMRIRGLENGFGESFWRASFNKKKIILEFTTSSSSWSWWSSLYQCLGFHGHFDRSWRIINCAHHNVDYYWITGSGISSTTMCLLHMHGKCITFCGCFWENYNCFSLDLSATTAFITSILMNRNAHLARLIYQFLLEFFFFINWNVQLCR